MKHPYLDSPFSFKIFAHRGLIYTGNAVTFDENTIPAFSAALAAGAHYLELDVQSSKDGVAIVFHDDSLNRVSEQTGQLSEKTWIELQKVKLNLGGTIPTLDQVLETFPNSKINIDVKSEAAIPGIASAVAKHGASSRVLLTSFSEKRRTKALLQVPGTATSPSAFQMLKIRLGQLLGFGLERLLAKVDILQIPVSYGILRLDSPRFIRSVKRHDVEVIYWTINNPEEALRLRQRGADGIVTDRTDLMVQLAGR